MHPDRKALDLHPSAAPAGEPLQTQTRRIADRGELAPQATDGAPLRRGRGRPPGSKNKKTLAREEAARQMESGIVNVEAASVAQAVQRAQISETSAEWSEHRGRWDRSLSPHERREEQRRRLLDVAHAILRKSGFEAVTVDAVTEAAEVGRQSFYAHFDGRAELLLALHHELARTLFAGFDLAVRGGRGSNEVVFAALDQLIAFVRADRDRACFVLRDAPRLGQRHHAVLRPLFEALASMLVLGSLQSRPLDDFTAHLLIGGFRTRVEALFETTSLADADRLVPAFRLLIDRLEAR